jgi:hypothetical protein
MDEYNSSDLGLGLRGNERDLARQVPLDQWLAVQDLLRTHGLLIWVWGAQALTLFLPGKSRWGGVAVELARRTHAQLSLRPVRPGKGCVEVSDTLLEEASLAPSLSFHVLWPSWLQHLFWFVGRGGQSYVGVSCTVLKNFWGLLLLCGCQPSQFTEGHLTTWHLNCSEFTTLQKRWSESSTS